MRTLASIALWLCAQWALMPHCLCQDGTCPPRSQAAPTCCQTGPASAPAGEKPDGGESPCPHCEGGEQAGQPPSLKLLSPPEPKPLDGLDPNPSRDPAQAGTDAARAIRSDFPRDRSAPPWWAAERSRISVFMI